MMSFVIEPHIMKGETRKAVAESLLLSRKQRKTLPQTLIFFVTSRCNARCDFCLYYEQITNPVAKELELTVDEVNQIAQNYGPLHYLALSGGETFVRKDLVELCEAFIRHCGTRVIDIPSNFYFTEAMTSTMQSLVGAHPSVIFDLQLSIDHVGESHDKSRQVKDLYERALRTFTELEKIRTQHSNLKLKVNIVYLERNCEALEEIVADLSTRIHYDRIQISYPNTLLDDEAADEQARADVEQFIARERQALQKVVAQEKLDFYSLGMRSVKGVYHRLLREAVAGRRRLGAYCEAGRHILVLNEKGDVFPCEPLWKSIGNLREHDYDVRRVLSGETYRCFREQHLGPDKCNCTWGCAMHSAISVNPKYLPELGINAAQLMLGGRAR